MLLVATRKLCIEDTKSLDKNNFPYLNDCKHKHQINEKFVSSKKNTVRNSILLQGNANGNCEYLSETVGI